MKLAIGQKLLTIREDRNMTQAEMADLLQIPDATYSRYERNETQTPYNKIVKFAELLHVPVQELLPETMSINTNNNNSGQGTGNFIFGSQYFYVGDSIANQALAQENQVLKEKLETLEKKLEELLGKSKDLYPPMDDSP